jgi:hypothetical protein
MGVIRCEMADALSDGQTSDTWLRGVLGYD